MNSESQSQSDKPFVDDDSEREAEVDVDVEAEVRTADKTDSSGSGQMWRYAQLLLFSSMIVAGIYLWWRRAPPDPPMPKTEGLDPAIVRVLQNCEQAVRRYPRSGAAWGRLGVAFLVYEFKAEARPCFEQAVRLDSSEPRWPYFFGLSLLPDQTEQSLEQLRRAVVLYRDESSAPRVRLANILSELGQYDEAEQNFLVVIEKWPDDPGAILGLGRLACARGDFAGGLENLNSATNSPHTARIAHQLLVAAHNRLGNPELASEFEAKLSRLPTDRPLPDPFVEEASALRSGLRAWVDYAALLVRQGRVDEAKPLAERAVKEYPESAEAWMLVARIHLAQKKPDEALKASERAVQLSPEAVEPHMQLGVTQLFRQRIDDAIVSFQRAVELKPELSESHHNLGLCYAAKKAWPEAIREFKEATRRNPGFVDSYLGLADSLARSGDKQAASEAVQKALELRPQDPRAHRILDIYGLGAE